MFSNVLSSINVSQVVWNYRKLCWGRWRVCYLGYHYFKWLWILPIGCRKWPASKRNWTVKNREDFEYGIAKLHRFLSMVQWVNDPLCHRWYAVATVKFALQLSENFFSLLPTLMKTQAISERQVSETDYTTGREFFKHTPSTSYFTALQTKLRHISMPIYQSLMSQAWPERKWSQTGPIEMIIKVYFCRQI